jgi:hypothetical protein
MRTQGYIQWFATRKINEHLVVVLMQAVWRGRHVRSAHPKAKRFAELRRKLARANANAVGMAHMSLAARTRIALAGLMASTHLATVGVGHTPASRHTILAVGSPEGSWGARLCVHLEQAARMPLVLPVTNCFM